MERESPEERKKSRKEYEASEKQLNRILAIGVVLIVLSVSAREFGWLHWLRGFLP